MQRDFSQFSKSRQFLFLSPSLLENFISRMERKFLFLPRKRRRRRRRFWGDWRRMFYPCEEKRRRNRNRILVSFFQLLTSSILQLQQISTPNLEEFILSWIESLWANLVLLYYLLGRCSPSDEGKSLTSCHRSTRDPCIQKSSLKIFFLNICNESRYP